MSCAWNKLYFSVDIFHMENIRARVKTVTCTIYYTGDIVHIETLSTVAQTRHFIKHLLHDFTKHLLHDFTNICSTILQSICSTILQFAPRFYNLLNDFTIYSKCFVKSWSKCFIKWRVWATVTIRQNRMCRVIMQYSDRAMEHPLLNWQWRRFVDTHISNVKDSPSQGTSS